MANQETLIDIKIPYPTEGTIRTAQIDDTVAPVDSVQLAANMNFDTVGAAQTRLGVAQYAPQLADAITNFGKLNNFTIPGGYSRIIELGASNQITAVGSYFSAQKVDANNAIVFWRGVSGHGFAQVMNINTTNGTITPVGTPLTFDSTDAQFMSSVSIDASHFLLTWVHHTTGTLTQVFNVDGGYNVTALSSPHTIDASENGHISLSFVSTNHYVCSYSDSSNNGMLTVLAINASTYAVTEPGSKLNYDTSVIDSSLATLNDGLHFINFWSKGKVQVFNVNASTFAITALSSSFAYDTLSQFNSAVPLGDGQHFINFWEGFAAGSTSGLAQVFSVNLSTFAVTAPGTFTDFQTFNFGSGLYNSAVNISATGGQYFANFWSDSDMGYTQIFTVTPSGTFPVALTGQKQSLGTVNAATNNAAVFLGNYRVADFWQMASGTGEGGTFRLDALPVKGNYLYAGFDQQVDNLSSGAWTIQRSGLSPNAGKPRFAQYLNYLWMVNGNAAIGDPIAVSNGGAFSTANTIIPANFPSGDFIHGGFEGRVWVADALYGVVYYTDIVQFTAPDIYVLTFDITVNFISQIAPQTGETITGMFEVPRALLIFTQNTITRIYGATSIDAYPAYNVGTYSQESIIQTKTGILFHHSSGIYQFDYGGQPVEISRRVIDFIQAIPRTNYGNITAVWDGFDAVEWAIGQVTVEGITFTNCVLRYTLSTQVWTVYDYVGNYITSMISFDDGTNLNQIMGTSAGKVGAMNSGYTDFGQPFYYDYIDRWRSFTDMYAAVKSISGINIYNDNAAGTNFSYQTQGDQPNEWKNLETIDENGNSLFPNVDTDDFNVIRLRLAGTTNGTQVVIHGMEILSITNKGYNEN